VCFEVASLSSSFVVMIMMKEGRKPGPKLENRKKLFIIWDFGQGGFLHLSTKFNRFPHLLRVKMAEKGGRLLPVISPMQQAIFVGLCLANACKY
jgi:hypothetical protein